MKQINLLDYVSRKTYYDYLLSDHWQSIRRKKLDIDPCCQACGGTNRLDIHHRRYDTLGRLNIWTDLTTLCRRCHLLHHKGELHDK